MKEFIEKLISKLEEIYNRNDKAKKKAYEEQDWEHFDLFMHRNEGVYTSISTVYQLAEEYNNSWIPCNERLPDVATCYLVTEEVIINSKLQYVVDIRLFGTENEWMCPSNSKIIAWQPLPVPFKKVGAV